MQPEPAEPPARRFPKALIAAYASGLGLGLGAIPLAAWVCDGTRDEMGLGFMLFCGAGAGAGCLSAAVLSAVSLKRNERGRWLAIANLAVLGSVAAFAAVSALAALLRR